MSERGLGRKPWGPRMIDIAYGWIASAFASFLSVGALVFLIYGYLGYWPHSFVRRFFSVRSPIRHCV